MESVLVLLIALCVTIQQSVVGVSNDINRNIEQPLLLTPFLEKDNISDARKLSKVSPDIGNTTSYSGYFTVDKECESHLFFWFFPAQENFEEAPVILWIQGGPGMSSLCSLFEEIGPLTYKDDAGVGRRNYSWDIKHNLIFIDQPVGTGYSFSKKGCYAENSQTYSSNLYSALVQFFKLFPELAKNNLTIAGHSYAGHFIPSLGHMIHSKNPTAQVKINLSTMMIGNGWMDALYQSDYGSYLYYLGLIDDGGKAVFDGFNKNITDYIKDKNWQKALEVLFDNVLTGSFNSFVGNVSKYNYLKPIPKLFEPYENFIQQQNIRQAIHVGNAKFSFINDGVRSSLGVDVVYSVKPLVEELLEHYPIVFYTGQLDVIAGYPMVTKFLNVLDWSGKDQFKNARRRKWCVGSEQVGYWKRGHNLYDVFVRNAGHVVTKSQPLWAYTLVNSVTSSLKDDLFHSLKSCYIA